MRLTNPKDTRTASKSRGSFCMRIAAWVHGSNFRRIPGGEQALRASSLGHALKSTLSLSRINASGFRMQGFIGTHIVEIRLGLYRSDSMRKDFNWMRA
jgi:hypothetical protein